MGGGSAEEIAIMLDEHYAGLINIADYWVVGDTRTESITAIPSGTTGEAQSAQSIVLVILGMNHDDKADGSGKTAVTVQTKNQLGTAGYMYASYNSSGYSLWSTSKRRTWCNANFKSALPTWLQNLIKPVTKVSNRYAHMDGYVSSREQNNTTDDVFLLSEFEVFGSQQLDASTWGNLGSDGTQYDYMKTTANRKKSGPASYWWLRSSALMNNGYSQFLMVDSSGVANRTSASVTNGIVPAFCL